MKLSDDARKRVTHREPPAGGRSGASPPWVTEDVAAVRFSLTITEVATARNISRMRRDFAAWLALDVVAGELADDLVLVVYEALANVVDHAYASTPDHVGAVRLVTHRAQETFRATVSDDGRWQVGTGTPFRNRGLSVIHLLVAQVHIDTTGSGTVVHLQGTLPAPEPVI